MIVVLTLHHAGQLFEADRVIAVKRREKSWALRNSTVVLDAKWRSIVRKSVTRSSGELDTSKLVEREDRLWWDAL